MYDGINLLHFFAISDATSFDNILCDFTYISYVKRETCCNKIKTNILIKWGIFEQGESIRIPPCCSNISLVNV